MNQHYLIGSSQLEQKIKNLNIHDYNQSSNLASDDLLASHPLITYEDNNSLQADVSTTVDEKIIIITSTERNFFNESLFDFKISFNKSSSKFISTPVYYNNPTVPQNIYERENGILGALNTNGWMDNSGNKYPKYNPNLEKGEIISYDSVLDTGDPGVFVNAEGNNMLSIKLLSAIIPNNLLSHEEVNVTYGPYINYLRFNIKPLDNNYNSSNVELNNCTDILVRSKTRDLGFTYFPINEYELVFDPPRNGLNHFNMSIRPNFYPDVMSHKQKLIFDTLFTNDSVSLINIEFFNSVIRLTTTYFKLDNWKQGMNLEIQNLLTNIMKNEGIDFPFLKRIETYFNENPITILYSCLRASDGNIADSTFLGNTIFIPAPITPNLYYQELNSDTTANYEDELKSLFPQSIATIIKKNYLRYFTTVFSFNKFSKELAELGFLKVNFNERIENIPQEGDTVLINLSMQCTYVFKIKYLKPKIDFNKGK